MTSMFLGPCSNGHPPVTPPQHCIASRPKTATHAQRSLFVGSNRDVEGELMKALNEPPIRLQTHPTIPMIAARNCQSIRKKDDPGKDFANIMVRKPSAATSRRPSALEPKDRFVAPDNSNDRLKKLPTVQGIYDTCSRPQVNFPDQPEAKLRTMSEAQSTDAKNSSSGHRLDGYPSGPT